jgi:hypothetical protein
MASDYPEALRLKMSSAEYKQTHAREGTYAIEKPQTGSPEAQVMTRVPK